MSKPDAARAAQDREWIARLMAVDPETQFNVGAHLARGLVHPRWYERAADRATAADSYDAGWRSLLRIMILTIEDWCQQHPRQARRATRRMTLDGMIELFYKEKFGAIRWETRTGNVVPRGLRETIWRIGLILETASVGMCQRCGHVSQVRAKPTVHSNGRTYYEGWFNTVCDACHQERAESARVYDEAAWADPASRRDPLREAPKSRTEVEVESGNYLAQRRPVEDYNWNMPYAHDVLEECNARDEADRERAHREWAEREPTDQESLDWKARMDEMQRPVLSAGLAPEHGAPAPDTYRVTLRRWRYEEAVVEIRATDAEQAAGIAAAAPATAQWAPTGETSVTCVTTVAGDTEPDMRTRLRIAEHHGELALLEQMLATHKARARAIVRAAAAAREEG